MENALNYHTLLEALGIAFIASAIFRAFVELTFWYSWKRAKAEMLLEDGAKAKAKAQ